MKTLGKASNDAERQAEAALLSNPAWSGKRVAYVPAGDGIVSPSHRGVDARRWKIAVDGDEPRYLLKVFHNDQKPFVDVARTFESTRQAAALGITPAAHAFTETSIIVDHLPDMWRTATMDDLRDTERLGKVIELKKRMHGSAPLASSETVFDRLRMISDRMPQTAKTPGDLWWMRAGVDDIEQAIASAGVDHVPAHADGLASNVMFTQDGAVQLVDFDEARNVDPYYELGILLNEAFVFDSEMAPALEAFDGSVRPQSLARCRLYAIADDLYWGLWAALMDATSPRGEIEFLKYANWRFLRCRMALRHPGLEERIRRL